jgi:hypothetical protein
MFTDHTFKADASMLNYFDNSGDVAVELVVKRTFLEIARSHGSEAGRSKSSKYANGESTPCLEDGECAVMANRRCRALSDAMIVYSESNGRLSLASLETSCDSTADSCCPDESESQGQQDDVISSSPTESSDIPVLVESEAQEKIGPATEVQQGGINWASVDAFRSDFFNPTFYYCLPAVGFNPSPPSQNFAYAAELEVQAEELEVQAAELKAQAQEAEEAAQMARAKARAPWRKPSNSNISNDANSCQIAAQSLCSETAEAATRGQDTSCPQVVPVPMTMVHMVPVFPVSACFSLASYAAPAVACEPMDGSYYYDNTWDQQHAGHHQQEQIQCKYIGSIPKQDHTTLMLRNVPNSYTRDMLLALLDEEGFKGIYDFVYVPTDFHSLAGLGYAFVNFFSNDEAEKAIKFFEGFAAWRVATQKVCHVSWSSPLQGLEAHVERFRNSPVMHEAVPECYKPVLFRDGVRQVFPGPTKRIRQPRTKRGLPGAKPTFSGRDA